MALRKKVCKQLKIVIRADMHIQQQEVTEKNSTKCAKYECMHG